jgi:hypothetical protein
MRGYDDLDLLHDLVGRGIDHVDVVAGAVGDIDLAAARTDLIVLRRTPRSSRVSDFPLL